MSDYSSEAYLRLIPQQHRYLNYFSKVVSAVTENPGKLAAAYENWPARFDIDSALGDQLDILGKWIGFERYLRVDITGVYFSWEAVEALGWESGRWKGSYDADNQMQSLGDDDYRHILKTLILVNHWDGSKLQLRNNWIYFFGNGDYIAFREWDVDTPTNESTWDDLDLWEETHGSRAQLIDNQDMSLTGIVFGDPPSGFSLAMMRLGINFFKPAAVRINEVIRTTEPSGAFFAWDLDVDQYRGWGLGEWGTPIDVGLSTGLTFEAAS